MEVCERISGRTLFLVLDGNDTIEIKNMFEKFFQKINKKKRKSFFGVDEISGGAEIEGSQNDSGQETERGAKELEKEKKRTLSIIRSLVDGILVFGEDGRLALVNPQVEKLMEVRGEDILGKSILKLNYFSNFIPLVSLLGGDIKEVFRKEIRVKENLILEVTTTPIVSGEGETGTLAILHDVTREKLVEKMKSEFVTVAAHQLRTPTAGIKWSLRMLLDGDLGEIPPNRYDVIEKAYKKLGIEQHLGVQIVYCHSHRLCICIGL